MSDNSYEFILCYYYSVYSLFFNQYCFFFAENSIVSIEKMILNNNFHSVLTLPLIINRQRKTFCC